MTHPQMIDWISKRLKSHVQHVTVNGASSASHQVEVTSGVAGVVVGSSVIFIVHQ